jgi:hypothetical protein
MGLISANREMCLAVAKWAADHEEVDGFCISPPSPPAPGFIEISVYLAPWEPAAPEITIKSEFPSVYNIINTLDAKLANELKKGRPSG